jgi:hypothetical protein
MKRRQIVTSAAAFGLASLVFSGRWAQALTGTPPQARGPFYPRKFPADKDADLVGSPMAILRSSRGKF